MSANAVMQYQNTAFNKEPIFTPKIVKIITVLAMTKFNDSTWIKPGEFENLAKIKKIRRANIIKSKEYFIAAVDFFLSFKLVWILVFDFFVYKMEMYQHDQYIRILQTY